MRNRAFIVAIVGALTVFPAMADPSGLVSNAQCVGDLTPAMEKTEFDRDVRSIETQTSQISGNLGDAADPFWKEFDSDGKAAERRKHLVESGHFRWDPKAEKLEYVGPRFFLSSESGLERLKTVRVSFIGGGLVSGALLNDYARILKEIDGLELLVTYRKSDSAFVTAFLERNPEIRNRIHLVKSEKANGETIWTQDGSKPFIAETESTLGSDPAQRQSYGDLLADLNKKQEIRVESNELPFQGGNVIVGNRHIFVGHNVIDQISVEYGITPENAAEILSAKWGNPVVPIGISRRTAKGVISVQADFHLDLSVAIVADPATKKEKVLIGRFDEFLKSVSALKGERSPGVETTIRWTESHSDLLRRLVARDRFLDGVEKQFQSLGYETVRIPGFVDQGMPLYNYTNVILTPSFVIFPDNEAPALDRAVSAVFSGLGYRPVPAKAVKFSKNVQGGIRCLGETFRYNFCALPIRGK